LSVAGDVGADDFPKKIVDGTVRCADHPMPLTIGLTEDFSKYGKINHIVNNGRPNTLAFLRALTYIPAAGFTFDKMLHTTPDDAFDIIMKIHARAPFRLIRQAAPYFRLKVCCRAKICSSSCFSNLCSAGTTREPLHH